MWRRTWRRSRRASSSSAFRFSWLVQEIEEELLRAIVVLSRQRVDRRQPRALVSARLHDLDQFIRRLGLLPALVDVDDLLANRTRFSGIVQLPEVGDGDARHPDA